MSEKSKKPIVFVCILASLHLFHIALCIRILKNDWDAISMKKEVSTTQSILLYMKNNGKETESINFAIGNLGTFPYLAFA